MDGVQLPLGHFWGGSLLYNTKFPEIPGTHVTVLGRMKGWVDLGVTLFGPPIFLKGVGGLEVNFNYLSRKEGDSEKLKKG